MTWLWRRTEASPFDPQGERDVSDGDDLISVYSAANAVEAYLVKNLLFDEGIQASVSEENEPFPLPITPSEVLVRRGDEAQARALVERYSAEQLERADRPDWTCPGCSAHVIGAFDECDVCGTDRPGSDPD